MSAVIQIEGLSKRYALGTIGHGVLFRDMQSAWARMRGKADPHLRIDQIQSNGSENFWALKDISLKIQEGDVVGIIGRNGAGKSTLLKILSRVTTPTRGVIKVRGRIASLLEVGTGFHPELTGRENIFLNGAILGMSKAEIIRKFDEIVDFSGVDHFVDTPVKRYSSGMYVRLAFAVAAHLEPEILVVDEVLAVGDIEFQKKCLGKMDSISKQTGKTILFVSHNMAAISALCKQTIYLKNGEIQFMGSTRPGLDAYLQDNLRLSDTPLADRIDRVGEGKIRFDSSWTEDANGVHTNTFLSGDTLVIAAQMLINQSEVGKKIAVAFQVKDHSELPVTDLSSVSTGVEFVAARSGRVIVHCCLARLPLVPGTYTHNVIVRSDNTVQDFILTAGKFQVDEGDFFGSGKTYEKNQGIVYMNQKWTMEPITDKANAAQNQAQKAQ